MSGDSPSNPPRSTGEKGVGMGFLGLRGLCRFARLGRELRLGSCTGLSMTSRCAAFAKATYRARILGKNQSRFEGRDRERSLPDR